MESKFIVYANEDVYLVKASSEKDAIDIIYNEEIETISKYRRGYISTKKSDLTAVSIDDELRDKKFICLT